jgi:demethylmenaquinone methyltransferase/2-methoxy-6-polyprenyl-1,4-benzoquinol methylase
MDDRQVIDEQIDYYRKKAPEYDATAASAPAHIVTWGKQIDAALDHFRPTGHVLEIACGTGLGTQLLLPHANAITAVDSSPEVIEIAKRKIGNDPRVSFVVADIFEWEPPEVYDVVFFRAWITHVPPERFEVFWDLVDGALKPGGRVFFDDDLKGAFEEVSMDEPHLVRRKTDAGDEFKIVKRFWRPDELESALEMLGWDIRVRSAGLLMWGEGRRRSSQPDL